MSRRTIATFARNIQAAAKVLRASIAMQLPKARTPSFVLKRRIYAILFVDSQILGMLIAIVPEKTVTSAVGNASEISIESSCFLFRDR